MEETVGKFWDKLVTHAARHDYPQAAVTLDEMAKTIGIFFRALSGHPGLRIEACAATPHAARRNWLQRLAGVNRRIELAWCDEQSLKLPARLAVFAERGLNRDLYLWLAALAADDAPDSGDWFNRSQWHTCHVLQRFPGMRPRYRRLVEAQLAIRPEPASLAADEAAQEQAIQQALLQPGHVATLPAARYSPQPVLLWLHPKPPGVRNTTTGELKDTEHPPEGGESRDMADNKRRQGERVDMPDGRDGLLFYRFETLLSWAEYVKVDRCTDDEEDLEQAAVALDDLDNISVARDSRASAKRLRFDLDLPSPANDDTPLDNGTLFPEWDYRKHRLTPDYCRIQTLLAADAKPCPLPAHLHRMARKIRAQFQALSPTPEWLRAQPDGSEIDVDAYLQHITESLRGHQGGEQGLYRDLRRGKRDMAALVLADLSLSTDSWVNDESRVIDVIRDTLYLFSEALSASGDRFALYGFSSRNRQHVRLNWLKGFNEAYNASVRGRLAAIRPGFYTRMGAAIRYTSKVLARQQANKRLLLILTDGKPNDLDQYEGRYGAEDTRQAILEARQLGLFPFCVTIDDEASAYLPHLFGSGGFVVIRRPSELPRRLPLLYAQLTR